MTLNAPQLLAQIETEWAGITGWCPLPKALDLAMAVMLLRPAVVVELGVWSGKSAIPMAMACAAVGRGVVHAVDPWSKAESVVGYDKPNADWWGEQNHDAVYKKFTDKVRQLNLENVVAVHRQKSDDFVITEPLDILHVDGLHTQQATADVRRFAPQVRYGGLVFMDDLGWTVDGIPHVAHAVEQLLKLGFDRLSHTKIEGVGEWALFQKVRAAAR